MHKIAISQMQFKANRSQRLNLREIIRHIRFWQRRLFDIGGTSGKKVQNRRVHDDARKSDELRRGSVLNVVLLSEMIAIPPCRRFACLGQVQPLCF
ncbi:MAG TPA: hypothetical protein VF509_10865 [Sphingobium sp.]